MTEENGKQMVYWEKTLGRWGRGEYLYAEGDRVLVDVYVEGGNVLEWIEVSKLVRRNGRQLLTTSRSEIPSRPIDCLPLSQVPPTLNPVGE